MARLTVRVGPLNGGALRKARTAADRTIKDVADQAEISKSFLNNLELGHTAYMSRRTFRRLVEALKVEPDSVLTAGSHEPGGGQAAETADVEVRALRHDERAEPDDMPQLRQVANPR